MFGSLFIHLVFTPTTIRSYQHKRSVPCLRKLFLLPLHFSFVGALIAQAQNYNPPRKPVIHKIEPSRAGMAKAPQKFVQRKQTPSRHFNKGQHYSDWRRHQEIKDHKRFGLRKPGRGQHWVKVDNQYLLIAGATGLIAGILAAQ